MGDVSSTTAALNATTKMLSKVQDSAKKKSSKEKKKKFKTVLARLCCCSPERDPASREDHSEVDYGIEDRTIRVNVNCCSHTWSNSCCELDYNLNKDCQSFVEC